VAIGCSLYSTIATFAENPSVKECNDTEKEIELEGSLASARTRSLFSPIKLVQNSIQLDASFLGNLGAIQIIIIDFSGNPAFKKVLKLP
jgi:hypothetical protein